jgi:hypothetical protein
MRYDQRKTTALLRAIVKNPTDVNSGESDPKEKRGGIILCLRFE